MSQGHFREFFNIEAKDFFRIFFLLFNSLTWFFLTRRMIYTTLNTVGMVQQERLIVWGIYDFAIIGSSVVGAVLSDKMKRSKLLCSWILLGTVASSLPVFHYGFSFASVLGVSFLWGVFFGLGMPSSLAYFADCTSFENRGRVAGIVLLAASASAPLVVMSSEMPLQMIALISTVWRGIGLFVVLSFKIQESPAIEEEEHISLTDVAHDRSFLLYLIPWFMFSVIAGFERLIFEHQLESGVYDFLRMIESAIGVISALIGGWISDLVGRKRVVIYGFISLGLAYAFLAFTPNEYISQLFSRIIDGIAWGVFLVVFVLVLWGDLSPTQRGSRERYYVVGSIPFFFADFIGALFAPYVEVEIVTAFSLASFFLFMAILPLMYAPETVPERKIELRRLRKYVEEAKKAKEKYEEEGAEEEK